MATKTINGAASTYFYGNNPGQTNEEQDTKIVAIMFPVLVAIILLLRLLCCFFVQKDREEHDAGARNWADRAPSSTVASAAAEVSPVRAAEPPLVCTYRKADGWEEDSCGVCLADLADGDVLRVLPTCMHYFHASGCAATTPARSAAPRSSVLPPQPNDVHHSA